jgi:hypothetical protein
MPYKTGVDLYEIWADNYSLQVFLLPSYFF